MWERKVKKTIFLLRINDYSPEICALTYPLIRRYAQKIGAEIFEITKRRWPDWPVVYEKLQIFYLAQELQSEWQIYFDADTLIHPDMPERHDAHSKKHGDEPRRGFRRGPVEE